MACIIVQEQGSSVECDFSATTAPPPSRFSLVLVSRALIARICAGRYLTLQKHALLVTIMADRQVTPPRATRSAGKLPPNPPTPEQIRRMVWTRPESNTIKTNGEQGRSPAQGESCRSASPSSQTSPGTCRGRKTSILVHDFSKYPTASTKRCCEFSTKARSEWLHTAAVERLYTTREEICEIRLYRL